MLQKLKEKCFNYETISYIICGVLTTAVDFVSYTIFRRGDVISVELAQGLSWVAAVLFASILNGQGDKPTMALILEKMRALKAEQTQTQTFSEADIEYLDTLIMLTAERMEKLS